MILFVTLYLLVLFFVTSHFGVMPPWQSHDVSACAGPATTLKLQTPDVGCHYGVFESAGHSCAIQDVDVTIDGEDVTAEVWQKNWQQHACTRVHVVANNNSLQDGPSHWQTLGVISKHAFAGIGDRDMVVSGSAILRALPYGAANCECGPQACPHPDRTLSIKLQQDSIGCSWEILEELGGPCNKFEVRVYLDGTDVSGRVWHGACVQQVPGQWSNTLLGHLHLAKYPSAQEIIIQGLQEMWVDTIKSQKCDVTCPKRELWASKAVRAMKIALCVVVFVALASAFSWNWCRTVLTTRVHRQQKEGYLQMGQIRVSQHQRF